MSRRDFTVMAVCFAAIFLAAFVFTRVRAVQSRPGDRDRVCEVHLRQLSLALRFYLQDHQGRLPAGEQALQQALNPYLASPEVWLCPADPDRAASRLRTSYEFNLALLGRPAEEAGATWAFRDRAPWHDGRRHLVDQYGQLISGQ